MAETPDDFDFIHNEVCSIHETWNLVLDLFKEDRDIAVLDESGSTAWMLIGNALLDSIILSLTRLITDNDSRRYGPKMRLQRVVDEITCKSLKAQVEVNLEELESHVASIKEHRDNRIAHWDREYAQGNKALPALTLVDFRTALEKLRALMNTVYLSRENAHFGYEYTRRVGDGTEVLNCLQDGLRLRQLRDAALDGSRSEKELLGDLRSYPDTG